MKRFLTLICTIIILVVNTSAQDFSKYRVPVYNSIEEYQQNLIGRTFTYIPPVKDGKIVDVNSMGTKSYPVTITSIRGRKKKTKADEMRWKLTSEYSDRHELVIYIGHEDTWWSDEFENTDVPLYDMESYKRDFENNVRKKIVGQTISHPNSNISYTVTDIRIGSINSLGHSFMNTYVLKNDSTGVIKEIIANDFEDIRVLGGKILHPNSTVSYTVSDVKFEENIDSLGYSHKNIYVLKNDSTGEIREIAANSLEDIKALGDIISHPNTNISYTITDIKIGCIDSLGRSYKNTYVLTNNNTGETKEIVAKDVENIKAIGETISHPHSKASYTIKDIEEGTNNNTYTIIKNTTGITSNITAENIKELRTILFHNIYDGRYEASLKKVEKPENPNLKYGKMTTIGRNSENITQYSYTDKLIDIIIAVGTDRFYFTLKNISDLTQRLVWNDAVFVDMDGTTSKVIHSGMNISQADENQTPSVIIKGAKLEDVAYPTKRFILPSKHSMSTLPSIKLMLPIQIKDIINEYIFEFDVNWVYTNPDYIYYN